MRDTGQPSAWWSLREPLRRSLLVRPRPVRGAQAAYISAMHGDWSDTCEFMDGPNGRSVTGRRARQT